MKRISPEEAQQKLGEGFTYVDVRTPEEFVEGHPTGAVNVPIALSQGGSMMPNPKFLETMQAHFDKDAKIIVGCKAGGRSLRAAQSLEGAGYSNILDQRAGFDGARDPFGQIEEPGWSRVGLPIETGPGQGLARK
jgi:rhodanese-related sulfurtransferase